MFNLKEAFNYDLKHFSNAAKVLLFFLFIKRSEIIRYSTSSDFSINIYYIMFNLEKHLMQNLTGNSI